ncbi:MAG: DUF4145 domain-containing protein [Bacteroidetes bacterium]|nr:DUF4145 domain-containing protein [Bacteroidota bacterium]
MSVPYKAPTFSAQSFNCPSCGAFSSQTWYLVSYSLGQYSMVYYSNDIKFCQCYHCNKLSIWVRGKMILPSSGNVPIPNSDLPESVIDLYNEAKDILNQSPRSAAALLRLAIEELLKYISKSDKSINHNIAKLVKEGLAPKIQKALDILRVIGNSAVHAGQIDINDNPEIANSLFVLINVIADDMITKPKEIDELYNNLPESDKETIEKRDNK